jgi:CubicO group peptidase (beta-lactamase class C family)
MNNLTIMKKSLAFSMAVLWTLVILLSAVGSAIAKENRVASGRNVPTALSQQGPTDPAELEAFLDGLLGKEMEEYHIAGAAVSVVKDGKLFFAKGYGYANLENKIPIDAEQTAFATGSVGKLFTWTAVMQLVEQGKLDLDADVNTYLDFRIPDTYPQPITLNHLLTHTSGFEERWVGSMVSDAKDLAPAGEWLVSHMAARVRPPGDCIAYSNYNAMLAGYIVARVSGQPYDQYIQQHILDPLGMAHSTARSPIPADLRTFVSMGYMYKNDVFQVYPNYTAQPALVPSGGQQASVTDMARFMIAHLQDGRYSDATIPEVRILEESTARQMHNIQYTPDPRLEGIAYGFFDFSDNGQRTIGHRGYAVPMNSLLLLLPDQNLGVYVVYNSAGGGNVANPHFGFQRAFFDHYFPAPAVAPIQPPADFSERAGRFVGSYRQTAFPYTSFQKVGGLLGGMTVKISDSGDGALLLSTPYGGGRLIEAEPLYFRQINGPFAIVFREDDRGRINRIYIDPINFTAFDRLDWYETPGFNMPLLLACVLIFLSMIPVALIRLIRDRHLSIERKSASHSGRAANWIILGICILNLLVVAAAVWGMMGGIPNELLDPPLILTISLGLGVFAAALTVGALVYTVLAWKNSYWSVAGRAYYTLVTVAAVAFVWFLNYWNLLGWRY